MVFFMKFLIKIICMQYSMSPIKKKSELSIKKTIWPIISNESGKSSYEYLKSGVNRIEYIVIMRIVTKDSLIVDILIFYFSLFQI
jgi:hypothetical protein